MDVGPGTTTAEAHAHVSSPTVLFLSQKFHNKLKTKQRYRATKRYSFPILVEERPARS